MDGEDGDVDRMEKGDDSSSDGDASDTEMQQQITELEAILAESPFQYDSHVELIQLLRQQGDLDKARQARQNMSEVFPLTEELWMEWLGDELPLASLPEAIVELRVLFEKAVGDYLSVPVWLEYAKFAVERMSVMPEGMEFPRDVFERGIIACGLHVSQAGALWDTYRQFEQAVLSSMQQMQQNDPGDDSLRSQVETQFGKVEKLFKRQLAVPLIGMESTFQEYQSFSDSVVVTEESLPAYARAKKRLEGYLPFENQLQSSTPPTLDSYRSYISYAKSTKADSTFLNTLYLRAVAHHCLDHELWKEYLTFLGQNFARVSSVLLTGYKQAVRNCPWVVEFWTGYARAQERLGEEHEEIVATFEKGLEGSFSEAKEYLQLWTAYCDYLRRRVSPTDTMDTSSLVELRKTFKRARDNLDAYYGRDGDPTDMLPRYHARLEARCYGNMEEVRFQWDDIMTRHGREAQYWLEYAELERYCGDIEACRKILQRAVNSASDDPEGVCQALLEFEREVGSLESYEGAMERCAAQLRRVKERREKAAEKEAQLKEEKKQRKKSEYVERKTTAKQDHGGKRQQDAKWRDGGRREGGSEGGDREGKRGSGGRGEGGRGGRGEEGRGEGKGRKRAKAAHVYFDDSEEEKETPAKKQRVGNSTSEDTKTMVAMETQPVVEPVKAEVSPDAGRRAEARVETKDVEGEMEVGGGGEGSKEGRTVFVSNLPFSTTEKELEEKFSECGELSDVRLIKTKGGKSGRANIYAYIEFSSPAPVQRALGLDRSDMNGRPMFVSPFREKGGGRGSGGGNQPKRSHGNSRATVYVSNIQHNYGEEDLKALFTECGEVKEVRLVRNRGGRSKGFAYIEFCSESSANAAVMKLDGHQLGLKNINVAISNPPKRGGEVGRKEGVGGGVERDTARHTAQRQEEEKMEEGGFVKPFVPRVVKQEQMNPYARKSKTHVSLLPRVVARKGESGEKEKEEGNSEETKNKMSNEDFRKLLMKQ